MTDILSKFYYYFLHIHDADKTKRQLIQKLPATLHAESVTNLLQNLRLPLGQLPRQDPRPHHPQPAGAAAPRDAGHLHRQTARGARAEEVALLAPREARSPTVTPFTQIRGEHPGAAEVAGLSLYGGAEELPETGGLGLLGVC